MPIDYKVDAARGLVLTVAWGVLTDAEVLTQKARLASDPEVLPGMKELADTRAIERLDVTPAGIWALVGHDRDHREQPPVRQLAIVASDDVVFGMARMYQALADELVGSVHVFRSMEEAAQWLGVE